MNPMANQPADLFVHRRTITWSDTDAAAIAYTARYPLFALEAIDGWFLDRLGADWFELHTRLGGGTPFVHMSMDFSVSLRPRDVLDTTVALRKAGRSSLEFFVTGRRDSGEMAFTGRFVCVFVDNATGKSRTPLPQFAERIVREAALARRLASAPAG
jgi:4-hydroxybenzoyl-CoA thioesterase